MQPRIKIETLLPIAYLLPTIIVIEGFASIAVEILTIRQLLPVVGSSVVVTSLIIGIFLLFLAIGYDWGGKVTDNLYYILRRNFLIASVWVGVGLSYFFIHYYFSFITTHVSKNTIVPLLTYLLIILSPAIFLLGQTLPITMNIVRQNQMAGAIAGKALGLSTIGSFLGATFTTLILMHYLGVAATVFIVFLLLAGLALLISQSHKALAIQTAIVSLASILIYGMNIIAENSLFVLTNNYGNYQILTHQNAPIADDSKYLVINESYSSKIGGDGAPFPYIEVMQKIIFDDLKLRNADILVLGAGGFTLSMNDVGNNHYTYVDIDDQIKPIVEPAFLEKIKGDFIADDARSYIISSNKKYDVIVLDVFSNTTSIPAHLLTAQFMQQMKQRLKEHGYVLFNIIANPLFNNAYSQRIDNTIRSVFGSCMVIPVQYHPTTTNLIYACSNQARVNDHTTYTDNLNTSTTDSLNW